MEGGSSVDARSGYVTVVLAGHRIAGAARWLGLRVGGHQSGGGDDQGEDRETHIEVLKGWN